MAYKDVEDRVRNPLTCVRILGAPFTGAKEGFATQLHRCILALSTKTSPLLITSKSKKPVRWQTFFKLQQIYLFMYIFHNCVDIFMIILFKFMWKEVVIKRWSTRSPLTVHLVWSFLYLKSAPTLGYILTTCLNINLRCKNLITDPSTALNM